MKRPIVRPLHRLAPSGPKALRGLGHPLYVNGQLLPSPVTISHVPGPTGNYYNVPAGLGSVDPSMGAFGAYAAYAPVLPPLGADAPLGPPAPPPPPPSEGFISPFFRVWKYVAPVSALACAYHGYKRNDSIGWALWWFLVGGIPVTPVIALAQGFGERKGMTANRSRRNGRKGPLTPRETIQRAARAAKRAGFDNVNEFSAAYAAKLGRLGLSSDDAWHIWLAAWNATPSPKKKSWRGNRRRR